MSGPFYRKQRWFGLASGGCDGACVGLFRLKLLPVVLNEVFLLSMTPAGIEVVLIHLGHGLFKVPLIVIETIYGAHDSGAMPASRAVQEKLAGGRIVYHFRNSFTWSMLG